MNNTMRLIGIDKEGKPTDLGEALVTPEWKAQELCRSMFGGDPADEDSFDDSAMAYSVCLDLLAFLRDTGQLAGGIKPLRSAYICKCCDAVYTEVISQCDCEIGKKFEYTEAVVIERDKL